MPVTDDINDVPLAFDIDDLMHVYDRLRRNAFDPSKSMIDTMASLLRQSAALLRIHVPQSHKLRSLFSAREIEAREREEAESRLAANWAKAGKPTPARLVINGHVIMTPADCKRDHENTLSCPVCDGGLQVCMNCPMYEAGIDEPCKGSHEARPEVVGEAASYTVPDDDDTFGEYAPTLTPEFLVAIELEPTVYTVAPTYTSRPDVVGPAFERAIAESSNL